MTHIPARRSVKLIRNCQQHYHNGFMIMYIHIKNILANAFSQSWFIQEPVPFGFFKRLGNTVCRNFF